MGLNLGNLSTFVDGREDEGETTDGWEEDDDDLEPEVFSPIELSFYSTIFIGDANFC